MPTLARDPYYCANGGFEDFPCDNNECRLHGAGSFVLTEQEQAEVLVWQGPYARPYGKQRPWRRVWSAWAGLKGRLPA